MHPLVRGVLTRPIVQQGDKIAQLIIEKVALPQVVEVADIDETERGEGGFGSTGKSVNGH